MADRVDGTEDPRTIGKPLRGAHLWRYRVGDYRVRARRRPHHGRLRRRYSAIDARYIDSRPVTLAAPWG
ncbi:MAG: hypothetical protein R3C32_10310 [Chloroflexota bacterium]